jgi:hypothetical protein
LSPVIVLVKAEEAVVERVTVADGTTPTMTVLKLAPEAVLVKADCAGV